MLARLRHRSVRRRHHHDRAIHLRGAGDHVLDIVRVTRAIDVGVMPLGGLILHVRHRDRDTACFFFRRVIDRIETPEFILRIVLGQHFRDRRRQGGLAVIDMSDRPDIYVRLTAIEFFLCHVFLPVRIGNRTAEEDLNCGGLTKNSGAVDRA